METIITERVQADIMRNIFDNYASIVNIRYFQIKDFDEKNFNKKEHYQCKEYDYDMRIRHCESESPYTSFNRAVRYIKAQNKEIKINTIYAFVLEGKTNGKELQIIAKDSLSKKGISNVYRDSKRLWLSKDTDNQLSKCYIFGINKKGKFFCVRPDYSNFEYTNKQFAEQTINTPCNTQDSIHNIKKIDKIYKFGVMKLFKKINKNNIINPKNQ
ncbi:MAG: hypothetical protein KGV44_09825 [Flavobacteriaceae bacterium]|nr:hypothetical protein [Flavobacteriaceae bacterium]